MTGRRLFYEGLSITVLDLNIECIFDPSINEIESSAGLNLLKKMLLKDPNERITVDNALKHLYFNFLEDLESISPSIDQFAENIVLGGE